MRRVYVTAGMAGDGDGGPPLREGDDLLQRRVRLGHELSGRRDYLGGLDLREAVVVPLRAHAVVAGILHSTSRDSTRFGTAHGVCCGLVSA